MSDAQALIQVDHDVPKNSYEELAKHIDVEELKRNTIKMVMNSTAGKNPLDYYLAELAVDVWIKNYDKTAEQLEAYIREADPMALGHDYEEGFSVVGDKLEPTPETYNSNQEVIPEEDESPLPISCSA
jgi:hypothetical protein